MKKLLFSAMVLSVVARLAAYIPQRTAGGGSLVDIKWPSSAFPIEWRMNPIVGGNVSGSREQADVVREAFQEWQNISTAVVSFSEGQSRTHLSR